ncbi:ROK family transcriptional regulator [Kineosporia mesophila]|uniref:ROK family transcriptional regulator n=1 Tax=Kineosporia mesophila TaxID=566012 RepID=A0ABP7A572_9ACTN|nr:ROK family protein [Kineosporia mesophila]MCD5351468.1 ROK family protein [Kineosporia mesophila]
MPATPGRALRPTTKVMPGQARVYNRSLVLQSLYSDGPQSRADLARVTSLTPVTIGALVSELISEGLAVELGPRAGARVGKPATMVGFDPSAAHIVSIDLSRDVMFRGAVLDLAGTVLVTAEAPRDGRLGEGAAQVALDLARELVEKAGRPVLGIGVGSPGVVDPEGTVLSAPNLGWSGMPLARLLNESLGRPVHVANDANAAALAEHSFGGATRSGVLVLTVGLGVGAGILLDGALVRGDRFAAGEIGHLIIEDPGPPCACGRSGCLESMLSVPRLRARLAELPEIERQQAISKAGTSLGIALAPVISTLDLGEVVLNGPPDLLGGAFLDAAATAVRRRVLPVVGHALELRLSTLHENAVLLGSAVLVLSGELGVS